MNDWKANNKELMVGIEKLPKQIQYDSVDFLRLIACVSVIIIHYGFQGAFGKYVHAEVLYAVPLFYIISGFFLYREDEKRFAGQIRKSVRRIGFLFFSSSAVLVVLNVAVCVVFGKMGILADSLQPHKILAFIVLNDWPLPIGGPIWYLQALVYGYICILLLVKSGLYKYRIFILTVLLILNSVFGEFSVIFHVAEWFPLDYVGGNFLFRAIPYLLLGGEIHANVLKWKITSAQAAGIIFAGAAVTVLELYILSNKGIIAYEGHFIGNTLVAVGCMLLALQAPEYGKNSVFARVGKENTPDIYLVHQPVGFVLMQVNLFKKMITIFPFVFVISLVISILYRKTKRKFMGIVKR